MPCRPVQDYLREGGDDLATKKRRWKRRRRRRRTRNGRLSTQRKKKRERRRELNLNPLLLRKDSGAGGSVKAGTSFSKEKKLKKETVKIK